MNRYSRQQQVAAVGVDGQKKMTAARVLVVGAGGLGSPVCTLLAGAGIGQITIVDHDRVSLSNLHRQTLYTEADVDELKAIAAKNRLSALNSDIAVNAVTQALSIDNVEALINNQTVVVDAADNFLVTYLLSDLCLQYRIPLVSASVVTTQGYLGVFCGTDSNPAPSYRAVFPTPSTNSGTCNTVGVTGPSVGSIGSLQAQEVLKVILSDKSQLLGKIMYLDLWDYRQQIIDFSQAPEPSHRPGWQSIGTLEGSDLLLDVRTPQEHREQPLSSPATNVPVVELKSRLNELDRQQSIVCVCRSGQRAMRAADILLKHGFESVSVTQA